MNKAGVAFSVTSFVPVPLLLAAVMLDGVWPWLALLYLTLFAFAIDELIGWVDAPASEFPAANTLSIALGVSHFLVLGAVTWRFGQSIDLAQGLALFLATGLFCGQIGNANAHELIHRGSRFLHVLGKWVYISVLFGHHTSAHRLIHHVHVATAKDPNTARPGESYYRFAPRAWAGSFGAGLLAETQRLGDGAVWRHPYAIYGGGAGLSLIASFAVGGWIGMIAFVALCLFTQAQLLMSDYVQHYGLQRRSIAGTLEPVGDAHSWNAPHLFTSHMMLNAPRHSAHHTHPSKRFDALELPTGQDAPLLPYSLPAMSVIALVPPLWRYVMNRRLAYWQTEALAELAIWRRI